MALNSNFRTLTADNIEGVSADRNYLKSSFENGQLTGWTEVSVALTSGLPTGTPTIGATAAASIALSATSVTPLSGSRSMLVTVASALTAGHGFISDEFTLDRMDLGKVLTVSFDYERLTGTYNFSGTLGSQTWMVYVYDATAGGANWIQPAGFLGMNQSSGPGRIRATFQSSVVAGQKYRVAVIASQAAAGASSIEFDNLTCSRQIIPVGQIRNPAGTIIATGSLTPPSGYLYCDGTAVSRTDYSELFAAIGTTYGVGNGTTTFNIPDLRGIFARGAGSQTIGSISYSATLGTKQNDQMQGHKHPWLFRLAQATGFWDTRTYTAAGTTGTNGGLGTNDAPNGSVSTNIGSPVDDGNGTPRVGAETRPANQAVAYHICFSSGNVQLSNDTDTRVVAARYTTSIARTINNTNPIVIYENLELDTHASYNSSTGIYKVPVSGIYRITGALYANAVATTAGFLTTLNVFKNNVYHSALGGVRAETSNAALKSTNGSTTVQCNAGDEITIRGYADTANTLQPSATGQNYISIERLSGPSVVAASETVGCSYYNDRALQANISSGGLYTLITVCNQKIFDTHNAYNFSTGIYTLPVSGTYLVSCAYEFNPNATGYRTLYIIGPGGIGAVNADEIAGSTANGILRNQLQGSVLIRGSAGQQISFGVYQSSGVTLTNYIGTFFPGTYFTCIKVGN